MNNQPLRQVMDTTYSGVVLTDDLPCAKDVERAKSAFFKQFNTIYHKINFVDKNVLIHLFRLHAMSFYSAETRYIKSNKKYLKNFLHRFIKLSNESVEETHRIAIMSFLSKSIYLISSIFWLRNQSNKASDYYILEAHAYK